MFPKIYEKPLASGLPVNFAAIQLCGSGADRMLTVISKLPASALKVQPDKKTKANVASVDNLVLVLNEDNSIAAKSGQQLMFPISDKQAAQLKGAEFVVRTDLSVAPGQYRLAVVVTDPATNASTVKIQPITIPDNSETKLRLS